ncbi:MAG: transposase [Gemmataceae bacterium]
MAIAFFSTWTTYGSWLPGDPRGWFESGCGLREPDAMRRFEAELIMTGEAITLNRVQRQIVETTITQHCTIRGWFLHAVNCRSNHVHAVVSAPDCDIEIPREQFKAWCSRRLNETGRREDWWAERGWDEYIDDDEALAAVIAYVIEGQDWQSDPSSLR